MANPQSYSHAAKNSLRGTAGEFDRGAGVKGKISADG